MESNTAEPIIEAFTKKTGLQVEYWRASATKAMDRALTELRAGKHLFDVMVNNSGATTVMQKEGIFAKYISPAAACFLQRCHRCRSRCLLPPHAHRYFLQQRHDQARRRAQVSRRSVAIPNTRQVRHARSDPAHNDASMGRQPVQNHGQGKGRKVYPRPRRNQAAAGRVLRTVGRTRRHRRNAHRPIV